MRVLIIFWCMGGELFGSHTGNLALSSATARPKCVSPINELKWFKISRMLYHTFHIFNFPNPQNDTTILTHVWAGPNHWQKTDKTYQPKWTPHPVIYPHQRTGGPPHRDKSNISYISTKYSHNGAHFRALINAFTHPIPWLLQPTYRFNNCGWWTGYTTY